MRKLDFFYFFGSVYAGLSVLRIRDIADAAGVTVRWLPFNVRPLMQENNVALRSETRKVRYMWRDMQRRAAEHGLAFAAPPVWPTDPDLLHNRVGALAADEGWIEPFTVETIKAWFFEGQSLGSEACLEQILVGLGKDAPGVLDRARSGAVAASYDASTEEARRHGIFGSPSFVTEDGEMFWGDDRLEEAVAWAAGRHPLLARG